MNTLLTRWKVLRYCAWFLAGVSGANLIGLFIAPAWQMVWLIRVLASVAIVGAWSKNLELSQDTRFLITAIGAAVQFGLLLTAWG